MLRFVGEDSDSSANSSPDASHPDILRMLQELNTQKRPQPDNEQELQRVMQLSRLEHEEQMQLQAG